MFPGLTTFWYEIDKSNIGIKEKDNLLIIYDKSAKKIYMLSLKAKKCWHCAIILDNTIPFCCEAIILWSRHTYLCIMSRAKTTNKKEIIAFRDALKTYKLVNKFIPSSIGDCVWCREWIERLSWIGARPIELTTYVSSVKIIFHINLISVLLDALIGFQVEHEALYFQI